jgi:ubiquinol-cytochrome c reductase cytochrome b subunit
MRATTLNKSVETRLESLWEKLALSGMVKWLRRLEISSGALTWNQFFGSLLLVLLVLLFLSGAFMAFYYSPVPGYAYDSVDYALFSLPFGDAIKGIHHYGWNLFLFVMGLHLIRGFIVGAYKPPRQLVWISGVLILLLVPAFVITGDLLPWDQKGYWSTQVRISIMKSVPLIGGFMVQLLQGGPLTGIVALTRFYVLHIIFLPFLLIVLIAIHFHFIWQHGICDSISEDNASRKTVLFFPSIVNRWLVLFLCVTLVLGLISWYWPPPLGDPADPTDSTFVPKPEWWVLFLNQLVSIFRGPWSVFGSVIIPGGLTVLLIAVPFIDSSSARHPARRKMTLIIATIIIMVLLTLSIIGYLEHHV